MAIDACVYAVFGHPGAAVVNGKITISLQPSHFSVGHAASTVTALGIARPGDAVGPFFALPQHAAIPTTMKTFFDNVTIGGGPAPARAYIE
jgi:hypothetical protein